MQAPTDAAGTHSVNLGDHKATVGFLASSTLRNPLLQVLAELASTEEVAHAAALSRAKARELAAHGTSLEGCPGLVAQVQAIVSESGSCPEDTGRKPDRVHKPFIEELGTQSQAFTAYNHPQSNTLKPAPKVEQWRKGGGASKYIQLPPGCAVDDVTVASDKGNMYVFIPGHQTAKVCTTSLEIKDGPVKYSKTHHCLRFSCTDQLDKHRHGIGS